MANDNQDIVRLEPENYPAILRLSEALRKFVDFVGRKACWLLLPMVVITALDVVARKAGHVQYWLKENTGPFGIIFESTTLQEMEWHLHTAVFACVLGFGYIYNTHVRVDLIRENLSFRKRAWLEFFGLTFFMIPFCLIVIYFSAIYTYDSWAISEISASQVGLPHRFIIKGVLTFGLIVAALAGVAVWLQVVFALWGPQNVRFKLMTIEWPEEEGTMIEGKKRLELDDLKEDDRIYTDPKTQESS
jgi:TRAP-type mannitol/chloroaromatic compound transport system permease small subunit